MKKQPTNQRKRILGRQLATPLSKQELATIAGAIAPFTTFAGGYPSDYG